MLVAIPLLRGSEAPVGYGAERMRVKAVRSLDPARLAPVVMETDDGSTIIWMVEQDPPADGAAPALGDEAQSDELEMEEAPQGVIPPKPLPTPKDEPAPKGGSL
jgi:hypothetical protein